MLSLFARSTARRLPDSRPCSVRLLLTKDHHKPGNQENSVEPSWAQGATFNVTEPESQKYPANHRVRLSARQTGRPHSQKPKPKFPCAFPKPNNQGTKIPVRACANIRAPALQNSHVQAHICARIRAIRTFPYAHIRACMHARAHTRIESRVSTHIQHTTAHTR